MSEVSEVRGVNPKRSLDFYQGRDVYGDYLKNTTGVVIETVNLPNVNFFNLNIL